MLLQSSVRSCGDVSCRKLGRDDGDDSSWLPSRGSNSEASCQEPIFQVPMLHQEEEEESMSGRGTDVDTCFDIR